MMMMMVMMMMMMMMKSFAQQALRVSVSRHQLLVLTTLSIILQTVNVIQLTDDFRHTG